MKQMKIECFWSKKFHKTETVGYVCLALALIYIGCKGLLYSETGGMNWKRVFLTAAILMFSVWCIHWKNYLSDQAQRKTALAVSICSPIILFLILEINFHCITLRQVKIRCRFIGA